MANNKVEQNEETMENGAAGEVLEKEETNAGGQQADTEAGAADEMSQTKAELEESKDKYLRLYSEFENFRRRTARERLELIKTAGEEVITSMIAVVDDFERARKSNESKEIDAAVKEGMELIYHKLIKTLEQKGLKVMEVGKGSDFNPELHEAVTQFPAPDELLKGKVIDVLEKGYLLGDKVVRFAKVVTGA